MVPAEPSPELSDELLRLDATGRRLPVSRAGLRAAYAARGDRAAMAILDALPTDGDGVLDETAVDELLRVAHREMQRLSEEFCHGARIRRKLLPAVRALARSGRPPPWRVVDIGCGSGYALRWLAARGGLPAEVALIGCDLNRALVEEARRMARLEGLAVDFVCGDALEAVAAADVYCSTGLLHHLRGPDLGRFLAALADRGPAEILLWDFQSGIVNLLGGWFFHALRARQPLVLHDGMASLRRMYSAAELLAACPPGRYHWRVLDRHLWRSPIPRVMHVLRGVPMGTT